jgi:hypothetical protein
MSQLEEKDVRRGMPSASDFGSLSKCPGKHQSQKGRKDKETSQAARGTLIHEFLNNPRGSKVLEGDEEAISMALAILSERDALLKRAMSSPIHYFNEERMWYRGDRYSGVPDVLAIKDNIGFIIDYKTGPIAVTHASENLQLMALAVLADYIHGLEGCHVAIIQPPCGPPHTHYYDKAALKKARCRITRILRAIEAKHPRLKAGEPQCRYCLAKIDCPAVKAAQEELMSLSTVTMLTGNQISNALTILPVVEGRCKALKEEASRRLGEDGDSVPGYGLGKTSRRRKVTNTYEAGMDMVDNDLVSNRDLTACATISFSKLVGAVKDHTGVNRIEAQFMAEEALGKNLVYTEVKPKVVEK